MAKMRRIKPKSWKEREEVFSEKRKTLPGIHLSSADFPEIEKFAQGEKYRFEMVVEMTSKSDNGGGFDIHEFVGTPERTKRKVNK